MTQYLRAADDPKVLKELWDAIDRGKCILLAGPSLCAQAHTEDGKHPPLLNDLLKGMVEWCSGKGLINPEHAIDICALIDGGLCNEAGQEIEDALEDRSVRQQCLREVLLCNEAQISKAHIHIASIRFRAYFTTYYDTFIETAYSAVSGRALAKYYEEATNNVIIDYQEGRSFILKLHGDVDKQDSIVFGDQSYERLLYSRDYQNCLQSLISMSSILFVGFGESDPNLEGLISKVLAFNNRLNGHWIVVPEGQIHPLMAKRLWKNKRISVIQYKPDATHSALESFLERLATPPSRTRGTPEYGTESRSVGVSKIELLSRAGSALELFPERNAIMSMTTPKPTKAIEVFFSYSHKDEELRDELEKHLSILKRQGVITGWYDRRIGAGREWEGEIDKHLNTAGVILLLISSDFLASDYCYDKEMKRAMERHEAGEARVIPVILRPVDWEGAPSGKLQPLPTDAVPVTAWPNRDKAFRDVAQGIRAAVEELKASPPLPVALKDAHILYILHLSDLHFGTTADARLWFDQLAEDLSKELGCSHVDILILSGDISNKSTEAEYAAAKHFLDNLCREFKLQKEQIIITPGNHDLNWDLAKEAYRLVDRDEYEGELKEGSYIVVSEIVIRVRDDEEKYKQRFAHFGNFYQTIKGETYPLEYEQQGILYHFPKHNLLVLGLNSAWQLDHHYTSRASIHSNALSNALTEIRRNSEYEDCLKFAVWHHPLNSPFDDRITDQGFMQRLAQADFRLAFHGHIHKADTSLYSYDQSVGGRKLSIVGAGTFGAPVREWTPGYPLQYNLLKLEKRKLTVETRCRREINGAWQPDAIWTQGPGKDPLPRYTIDL